MFVMLLYQQALFIPVGDDRKKKKNVGPLTKICWKTGEGCQTALSVCASNAYAPQSRFIEKNIVFLSALLFLLINTVRKIIQLLN